MSDHHSHPLAEPKTNSGFPFVMLLGIFSLILLLVVGGLLLGRSDTATEDEDSARSAVRIKNLAELQAADTTQLTTYGWVNQAKGIVHIPIDRAMELVLPSLNAHSEPSLGSSATPAPATQMAPTVPKP